MPLPTRRIYTLQKSFPIAQRNSPKFAELLYYLETAHNRLKSILSKRKAVAQFSHFPTLAPPIQAKHLLHNAVMEAGLYKF